MSEPIINGIDVSEEIRYCNNCSNLGLDFETGKFYCSLSHKKDDLPDILSCDNFKSLPWNDNPCDICRYKQALEEIREVAEICMSKNIDNCYTCKFYNECEIEDMEIPTRDVCKLIKNKINEVLNDRD